MNKDSQSYFSVGSARTLLAYFTTAVSACQSLPRKSRCLCILVNFYNVIFAQYRVGRGGRRFKLYKLRTMRRDTPKYMSTSEVDDPDRYITRVGHILRRLSIDELPQLINVLKGDMSIIGPRPLISDEHEIHDLRMKFGVYKIRPGLTGLAQIRGRDMVTPADKVHWDVRYLEEFGFWTDVKIILSTIPKIIGGNGFAEGFRSSANEKEEIRH